MLKTPSTRYDRFSQGLHWITALAVTVAFVLGPEGFGRLMDEGTDPASRSGIVWHESLGLLVLALTVVRLVWLPLRPAAPQPPIARWMHALALLAQLALWGLLIAIPVTALLNLASADYPLTLLGGVRVESLAWLAPQHLPAWLDWGALHGVLGDTIMVIAGLHAGAALFHHAVLKDGVLASMLPWHQRR